MNSVSRSAGIEGFDDVLGRGAGPGEFGEAILAIARIDAHDILDAHVTLGGPSENRLRLEHLARSVRIENRIERFCEDGRSGR